eukprot:1321024-Amphidinium_carterae.2
MIVSMILQRPEERFARCSDLLITSSSELGKDSKCFVWSDAAKEIALKFQDMTALCSALSVTASQKLPTSTQDSLRHG